MITNTEIKGFMARISEKKAAKGIMDEWGAFGYTMEEDEMIAEITDLRVALEAKQQALEAAQQVAQRAGSGKAIGYITSGGLRNLANGGTAVIAAHANDSDIGRMPVFTTPPAAVQSEDDNVDSPSHPRFVAGFKAGHQAGRRRSEQPDSGRDPVLLDRETFEAAYIAKMQGRWPDQPLDKYDVESFLKRDANGDYITAYPQWIGWELARVAIAQQGEQAPGAK